MGKHVVGHAQARMRRKFDTAAFDALEALSLAASLPRRRSGRVIPSSVGPMSPRNPPAALELPPRPPDHSPIYTGLIFNWQQVAAIGRGASSPVDAAALFRTPF